MPTKSELTDQLGVTQKLASVIDQMASSMSKVEASYDTQISAVEKLTKAIEGLKATDLSSLNNTKLDKVQGELGKTEKSATTLSGRIKDLGQDMAKRFPGNAAIGAAALSGFIQGIKNTIALGKGVTDFFSGLVDWVANLAASIISIPFAIFDKLVNAAASAGTGMNELAQAVENLRKEMGDLKGPASKAVLDTTKTLKGFSDTGLSSWRVFGTLAERLEFVTKDAVAMGSTFGVLRKEFVDNGGALLAFQKGLGASEDGMKAIGDRAITMGVPMTKVFMDMTKQTLALGDAFDIDQKLIGKDMTKAMQDVKHFGQLTVKEIGQASVYARKLGLELDKIVGTLDAFETLDSAAENASKLSQAFGANVDAFKLMEAQNPAEQIDMLRKSFKEAGVDASTFSRQQLKLLANTTGLDEATAKQAFSSKNYGVSLDAVKKKSEAAEHKTLTQAEAMGKLADSIERMVKAGAPQEGSFWGMFLKGISAGIQSTGEFRGIIMNIKIALQQVYMIGVKLGKVLPSLIPGLKDFLGGIKDFFNPKHFIDLFSGISNAVKKYLDKDSVDKGSIPVMMSNLHDAIMNFFSASGSAGKRILDGFKGLMRFLADIAAKGVVWLSDNLKDGIEFVIDLITGKKSLSASGVKGAGGDALGFLGEILTPIGAALSHAGDVLGPPLYKLVMTLGGLAYNYITSDEFISKVSPAFPYLAAILFGPALGRAVLTSLSTTLIKSFGSAIATAGTSVIAPATGAGAAAGTAMGLALVAAFAVAAAAVAYVGYKLNEKVKDDTDTMMKGIQARNEYAAKGSITTLENAFKTAKDKSDNDGWLDAKMSDQDEKTYKLQIENAQNVVKARITAGNDLVRYLNDESAAKQRIAELSAKGELSVMEETQLKAARYQQQSAANSVSTQQDIIDKMNTQMGVAVDKSNKDAVSSIDDANKSIADKLKQRFSLQGAAAAGDPKEFIASTTNMVNDLGKLKASVAKVNIDDINDQLQKLSGIKFDVLSTFTQNAENVPKVLAAVEGVRQVFAVIGDIPKEISKVVSVVQGNGMKPALDAVQKMVDLVNQMDDALSDGGLNKVNIATKLGNVARSVGLGSKAQYTVKNKDVVVQINLQVSMNVDDVEKVIVLRKKSIIRDRINMALGGDNAPGNIPDNAASPAPVPFGGGSTP